MRHVVVRRTAYGLGAGLLVCAGAFAWLAGRGPVAPPESLGADAARGAALFLSHCASCHTAGDLRTSLEGPAARRAEVEQFLADHGDAADAEDRQILDYLAGAEPVRDAR